MTSWLFFIILFLNQPQLHPSKRECEGRSHDWAVKMLCRRMDGDRSFSMVLLVENQAFFVSWIVHVTKACNCQNTPSEASQSEHPKITTHWYQNKTCYDFLLHTLKANRQRKIFLIARLMRPWFAIPDLRFSWAYSCAAVLFRCLPCRESLVISSIQL